MLRKWSVLIVSGHLETRRILYRMLDGMSVDVTSCMSLSQAEEVLSHQEIELVFCHETLPDGSFRELLNSKSQWKKIPKVVVTFRVGEWPEYLEALRLGVFEVIPIPLNPTDVELAVIRALRPEPQTSQQPVFRMAS